LRLKVECHTFGINIMFVDEVTFNVSSLNSIALVLNALFEFTLIVKILMINILTNLTYLFEDEKIITNHNTNAFSVFSVGYRSN
jgi:hypothetical protein